MQTIVLYREPLRYQISVYVTPILILTTQNFRTVCFTFPLFSPLRFNSIFTPFSFSLLITINLPFPFSFLSRKSVLLLSPCLASYYFSLFIDLNFHNFLIYLPFSLTFSLPFIISIVFTLLLPFRLSRFSFHLRYYHILLFFLSVPLPQRRL